MATASRIQIRLASLGFVERLRHIVEFEQGGTARVTYGKSVLAQVSTQLPAEFGKGFDASNLYKVSQFYRAFPNLDALRLNLSWTH